MRVVTKIIGFIVFIAFCGNLYVSNAFYQSNKNSVPIEILNENYYSHNDVINVSDASKVKFLTAGSSILCRYIDDNTKIVGVAEVKAARRINKEYEITVVTKSGVSNIKSTDVFGEIIRTETKNANVLQLLQEHSEYVYMVLAAHFMLLIFIHSIMPGKKHSRKQKKFLKERRKLRKQQFDDEKVELKAKKRLEKENHANEKKLSRGDGQPEIKTILAGNKGITEADILERTRILEENKDLERTRILEESKDLERTKILEENKNLETTKILEESKNLETTKILEENKDLEINRILEETKSLGINMVLQGNKDLEINRILEETKSLDIKKNLEENKDAELKAGDDVKVDNIKKSKPEIEKPRFDEGEMEFFELPQGKQWKIIENVDIKDFNISLEENNDITLTGSELEDIINKYNTEIENNNLAILSRQDSTNELETENICETVVEKSNLTVETNENKKDLNTDQSENADDIMNILNGLIG